MEKKFFPMFLNLEHKRFLVIGAGNIAVRRIKTLLRYGADIRIIAEQYSEEAQVLIQNEESILSAEQRPYKRGDILEDFDFVLTATNDSNVDMAVCLEARHKEIPVNVASRHELCDYYFPALVEREHLTIGMTSDGWNHSYLKKTAEYLREHLPEADE
ncbi:MAG: bifunctional precorrin-2 dehydrogenase/sirohydrochlorin ferrochelatase [Lachnospiraceae bacterium]